MRVQQKDKYVHQDTYDFYVLNDDGDKVTLIIDNGFGVSTQWYGTEEYIEDYDMYMPDSSYGPLDALRELKDNTSDWGNIEEYSYILDYDSGYQPYSGTFVQNVRTRMPSLSDLVNEEIGCIKEDYNLVTCPETVASWLYPDSDGDAFWLSYAGGDGGYAWAVDVGALYPREVTQWALNRPVIEIPK